MMTKAYALTNGNIIHGDQHQGLAQNMTILVNEHGRIQQIGKEHDMTYVEGVDLYIHNSFPSGHALTSCCFFGAFAAILTARIKSRRVRTIVWILAITMFLLIGLSRIYLGVHHTTDVIAGFAAALIWILFVRFVEMHLRRRRRRKEESI